MESAVNIDCVRERFAAELAARDKATEELQNLQKNLQAAEDELETIRAELGRTLTKSEEALKAGRALDRIDSKVGELARRRDILLDRIDLLHRQDGRGWTGLIETAGKALSDADHRLAAAVVRALEPAKREVADEMSQDFCRGMARYDSYNDGCKKLFQELRISGLTAGSLEIAPLPSCPDLYLLLETGLLRGGPETPPVDQPPTPQTSEPEQNESQAEPERPGPDAPPTPETSEPEVEHIPHEPVEPITEPFGEPMPEGCLGEIGPEEDFSEADEKAVGGR